MAGYGTNEGLSAYAVSTGRVVSGDPEVARNVGAAFIDGSYGPRFSGIRTGGFAQARAWPRTGAVTSEGFPIPSEIVPETVIHASYEAALRHDAKPGSLSPDQGGSGRITSVKAGSVAVDFADPVALAQAGISGPTFPAIDALLAGLLMQPRLGIMVV